MLGFVGELGKGYVNRYSMQTFEGPLTEAAGELVTPYKNPEKVYKLTSAGRRVAKVFLTIFNILHDDLSHLHFKCEHAWKDQKLCLNENGEDNLLGQFLKRGGYKVADNQDSKDGELNFYSTGYNGTKIYKYLNELNIKSGNSVVEHLRTCEFNRESKTRDFNIVDVLNCLLEHVNKYNEVYHLSTLQSRKQPCSVYEMLIWLNGLPHNPVYQELLVNGIGALFETPDEESELGDGPMITELNTEYKSLEAYPRGIKYDDMCEALTDICSNSYDVLCTIIGTGDAATIYGCDYSNNSFNLSYPTSGEDCLHMFIDVCRRVFPVLQFMRRQCKLGAKHFGWRDCEYGRMTPTTKWPCTDHPTDKSKCQPNCQPKSEPNDKPTCRPTSPLQSYLNDCLPGHLPHQLTSIGCKAKCTTCPGNKPGMPCLTPLGFRAFSGETRKGGDLCEVLTKFFKNRHTTTLLCLIPTPPVTLPEHFGFALALVNGWNANGTQSSRTEIESSIRGTSIQLYDQPTVLTNALINAYGSEYASHDSCEHPHLMHLTASGNCTATKDNLDCVPYVSSVCSNVYSYFVKKHADTYLSWCLYLPWAFWKYLECLYNAFRDIQCQDWGCVGCIRGDRCKRGEHGAIDETSKASRCKCASIVQCRGVSPMLYQHGFTFGNAIALNATNKGKLCSSFCAQLKSILHSKHFSTMFEECDNFLYYIRFPFMTLTLSLWLLSLLYLLHIMVIRLDLLHIKSHLHSPSSHRIAAQSLLAAGRVTKLNRVFYLQP